MTFIRKGAGRRRANSTSGKQRGMTLVIALIALGVLTFGAIALNRSTSASLLASGNLAFKRDLTNQGERAIAAAIDDLRNGSLESSASRSANLVTRNYSATRLASSDQGIPNVLVNETTYGSSGFSLADIDDAAIGVKVRYVIDRQCTAAGAYSEGMCQSQAVGGRAPGGSSALGDLLAVPIQRPVYRISVRVTGPRGVQTYMQTTVAL